MAESGSEALPPLLGALVSGDRRALARAISLVESSRSEDREAATRLLAALPASHSASLRIGVTGVPGAGKSTLIEALSIDRIGRGERVAVLTIDPSSERSGGSLLGDVTRMPKLAASPLTFVRTTPSRGVLGGTASSTREAIALCEAAGYHTLFIETLGVGQAEQVVSSMVDYVLLVAIAGAGDEIQGLKRGILESVDGVAINKADGDNQRAAEQALRTYEGALRLLRQRPIWVGTTSASERRGIAKLWQAIEAHVANERVSNRFAERRQDQHRVWFEQLVNAELKRVLLDHPAFQVGYRAAQESVAKGETPSVAASRVVAELHHLLART